MSGMMAMTQEQKVNKWFTDYEQVSQQWQDWLDLNIDRYPTAESAWQAFKAQYRNLQSLGSIKKDLR